MSQEHALPKLSVVVISFNSPLLLERCLSALERQTLNDGVETLVVRQRDANLDEHENLERRFQQKWAVGELVGSLFGPGQSLRKVE